LGSCRLGDCAEGQQAWLLRRYCLCLLPRRCHVKCDRRSCFHQWI